MPQDYAAAISWFRKAAAQGLADAQHNLGSIYYGGTGVPQDYATAASWFRKAAGQENSKAQTFLGLMYDLGRGVPQDYVQAHKWLNLGAAKATDASVRELATSSRDRVAVRMTPAQIAEAHRLASEWEPGSPSRADQPQTITISSEAKPVFMAGRLQGCSLNFEAGREDAEFSQGRMTYLTGSLVFNDGAGQIPFFAMKLGVKTDSQASQFSAPAEVILLDGNKTNKDDFLKSVDGEVEGFRMFVFKPGETTMNAAIGNVLESEALTFAYAMKPGGMNAIVSVDLRIKQLNFDAPAESLVDGQTAAKWWQCFQDVVDGMEDSTKP